MSKTKKESGIFKKVKSFFMSVLTRTKKIFPKKKDFKLTPLRQGIIIVILVLFATYLLRSLIFVAFVDGKPVFRANVLFTAEKQIGSTVLENLIEKKLIFNEARKQNIKVSEETISEEIENIKSVLEEQNVTLEEALSLSGQNLKTLKEQIKVQKIVEALLDQNITISEEEVEEYYSENKEYFGSETTMEDVQDQIKEELYNQKLTTEYTNWIAQLKLDSNIKYIVNY